MPAPLPCGRGLMRCGSGGDRTGRSPHAAAEREAGGGRNANPTNRKSTTSVLRKKADTHPFCCGVLTPRGAERIIRTSTRIV